MLRGKYLDALDELKARGSPLGEDFGDAHFVIHWNGEGNRRRVLLLAVFEERDLAARFGRTQAWWSRHEDERRPEHWPGDETMKRMLAVAGVDPRDMELSGLFRT